MMIRCVDHLNIVVQDLAASVHFYTRLLGFAETRRATLTGAWIETIVGLREVEAEVVYVQPPGGGPRLELIWYRRPTGTATPVNSLPHTQGLRHIAFQVDGIDQICERLSAAGVHFVGPPTVVPATVVMHDAGHKVLCYFFDPDGVILELAEYRQ